MKSLAQQNPGVKPKIDSALLLAIDYAARQWRSVPLNISVDEAVRKFNLDPHTVRALKDGIYDDLAPVLIHIALRSKRFETQAKG